MEESVATARSKSSGKAWVGVEPELEGLSGAGSREVAAELLLNSGAFQSSHSSLHGHQRLPLDSGTGFWV